MCHVLPNVVGTGESQIIPLLTFIFRRYIKLCTVCPRDLPRIQCLVMNHLQKSSAKDTQPYCKFAITYMCWWESKISKGLHEHGIKYIEIFWGV